MKRPRRFNPFIVFGVICVVLLVPIFFFSRKSPENYAAEFMTALGTGNADQLAHLSTIGNDPFDERKKLWQQSLNASKYYAFTWRISNVTQLSDDHAAITLMVRRNLQLREGLDEEQYMLPIVKTSEGWQVPVDQMDRDIFPYLPRQ